MERRALLINTTCLFHDRRCSLSVHIQANEEITVALGGVLGVEEVGCCQNQRLGASQPPTEFLLVIMPPSILPPSIPNSSTPLVYATALC